MTPLSYRLLLACCLPVGLTSLVYGEEADVLHLRASLGLAHDDNLFRTPASGGPKPQSETIATTIVGADFDKRVSLQEFIAHVSWVDTRYQHNDYLNAGTLNYDGHWLWEVSSKLKGELAADRSAAQNSFADFRGLRERNLRTIENQQANVNYAINPSWQAMGGVFHQTIANDSLLAVDTDQENNGARIGLRFVPESGNWLSWQSKHIDGKYNRRPFDPSPAVLFDNGFIQTGEEFVLHYQASGHSTVNGRLEYVDRRHDHFSQRDFSGWTGQLSYLYQYSDKTALSASYLRDLATFQQITSSYYVADDVTLGAQWAASDKVSLAGRVSYIQRRYRGEILPLPAGQPQQEDHGGRVGVDLIYHADRWLDLRVGVQKEKRNSNIAGADFSDKQIFLSASARF